MFVESEQLIKFEIHMLLSIRPLDYRNQCHRE